MTGAVPGIEVAAEPPAAPAEDILYFSIMLVGAGCQIGRAHCRVKRCQVGAGCCAGVYHGGRFYGSFQNFHGSKSNIFC